MHINTSVRIEADRTSVWRVLVDVEQWPQWTTSMRSVEILDGSVLGLGTNVKIKQPMQPVTRWTVTDWREGAGFRWESVSPGTRTTATHDLADDAAGTRVRLTFTQTGALARLSGLLLARLSRRYVEAEAQGLKHRCESSKA